VTPVLETARLLLRPLELADAEQVQKLFPQWEVVRLLASIVPWPFPDDGVRNYYEHLALPAVERGDEWHWTLRLKTQPDQVIGAIEVCKGNENNRGFWLGRPWQGQGLMSEACDAVTDYWFNALGFEKMRVPKATANAASRRISEKQGMRMVETKESNYVSGRLPTEVWEITAEEWRERSGGAG
jgi:ribosomal-protein-alanine N-acetyltransferase